MIKIVEKEIATISIEAIVNPVLDFVLPQSKVNKDIHEKAGGQMLEDCKPYKGNYVGKAIITEGYNLPTQFVIHAMYHPWLGWTKKNDFDFYDKQLTECYENVFKLVVLNDLKRLAIFPIGLGTDAKGSYPTFLALDIAFRESEKFLQQNPQFEELVFVADSTFLYDAMLARDYKSQRDVLDIHLRYLYKRYRLSNHTIDNLVESEEQLKTENKDLQTLTEELRKQNEIIEAQRKELFEKNHELEALAEELRQQSDALIEQRNELEAITEELKQQNEVVEAKNKALEQLQDTKDLMISAVNHDLRNPLNPILNFSRADYPAMTEAERLASIHAHAGMMLKLIDNTIQIYRADKITIQPAPHTLHRATEEAIAVMLVSQNRKPKIINDIPQDLQASFDYPYIERVLENFLSNAIKYTAPEEKGGIVRFFAEVSENKEMVKISIQDNGKGIPQDQYESIFLPFVNPDAKSIGSAKSVGIGLTFCKTIIEAHHSCIELASEVGKGTIFSFALPYVKPETPTAQPEVGELVIVPLTTAEKEAVAEHITHLKALGWRDGSLTVYIEDMRLPALPTLQAWKNALLEARKQRNKTIFEKLLN